MGILKKIREIIISKNFFFSMVIILFNISTLLQANPIGEKTISTVTAMGPATVTTNLTMFSEATTVGTTPAAGTLRGVTLMVFSHNCKSYSDGLYWMSGKYKIEDTLKGEYKISNVKANIMNSSSASVDIDLNGSEIKVEIDDYLANDSNKQATVEVVGDITYTSKIGELGKGTVVVGNMIESVKYFATVANLNSPIEVNQAIILNTKPLSFGNVIPLTGKYEKDAPIDIVGAKGTEVTISLNGAIGQELNGKLESGRNKIPITYRIENGSGNMINDLNLGASGIGSAVLKGIINSDNIPRGQVGGSYIGSVTIEVDYK